MKVKNTLINGIEPIIEPDFKVSYMSQFITINITPSEMTRTKTTCSQITKG